ncbi:hypothetical protein QQS21_002410 [Conoideocrella luteorostrata]|uniref:Uncharacterized protein n=1 Tax=Conoideocrella luteorostrata TaxID=1105319 RepID=A0AAJ0CY23_9HYPO|nr:hypothetical protein QQS21_002410 [Conoideocrella luteorostrata]
MSVRKVVAFAAVVDDVVTGHVNHEFEHVEKADGMTHLNVNATMFGYAYGYFDSDAVGVDAPFVVVVDVAAVVDDDLGSQIPGGQEGVGLMKLLSHRKLLAEASVGPCLLEEDTLSP